MSDQPAAISLREALPVAMSRGDKVAVRAIRSVLAEMDNATAVPSLAEDAVRPGSAAPFAASVAGLGATEAARAELTEAEVLAIISEARDDRLRAALVYRDHGKDEQAERMLAEAEVLDSFLC